MSGHILVDGNAVAHAYHQAMRLNVGTFQTQAIFGVTKAMRDLLVKYPGRKLIVLWDGKAKWRFELHPEYKGNRKPKTPIEQAQKESYKAQVPVLRGLLQRLGVAQLLNYDLEADDLAGYMVPRLSNGPVLLVTGDRDWWQLIRPGVTWFDPRSGDTVDSDKFFSVSGYKTAQAFVQGKALMGDRSDNISGVGGIGEKTAPELLALFGSVDEALRAADEATRTGGKAPMAKALAKITMLDARARYTRNLKLMDLLAVPTPQRDKFEPLQPMLDLGSVRAICQRLAFMTILKDFTNFTQPFVADAAARGLVKEAA